jgi:DNA invertase Pin-like site-specific DNA recombinase
MKYVENGGKLGRTPKINKSKTDLILELLEQGKTKQEIADFLIVDRTTIYRTLKRNGY